MRERFDEDRSETGKWFAGIVGKHCPEITGIDLSLTNTGLCTPKHLCYSLPAPKDGLLIDRAISLVESIVDILLKTRTKVCVIEDMIVGGKFSSVQTALVHGVLQKELRQRRIRFQLIAPKTLKKYATGTGNADKPLVLREAITRLEYGGSNFDEADAFWLCALGQAAAGYPCVELPAKNREALKGVEWTCFN